MKERFLAFLSGDTPIVADEAFCNAARSFYEARLSLFAPPILVQVSS